MAKSKKVVKAVATVTVFSVFTRGLSFIFKIYLSRALGAETVGLYQICISMFYLFACLSSSGIPLVLSRKTAEQRALNNDDNHSLFSSALILGICISVVTVVILTVSKPYLPRLLSDPKIVPMFIIMAPAIISTTIYNIIRGWFWGRKEFTSFSITETIEEILRILFSVLFISGLISGLSGAMGIALAFLVSDFIVAALLFIMFKAKGGKLSKPKPTKIKEIFIPALPVTAIRLFGNLIATLMAVMLPARLIDAGFSVSQATASFGRIAGMANPLLLAPNAIITSLAIVLIPEMSEQGVKNEYAALNKHINTGINFALIISGFFMLCYYSLGEEITSFLFHDAESGRYLQYATFIMLPMCISQLTQSALNSIGMEFLSFKNYMLSTVFMIAGIYFLPAVMGIYSVALATTVSFILNAIFNLITIRKKTNYRAYFIKTLVMVIAFVLLCGFFSYSLYGILKRVNEVFALCVSLPLGCAMYLALLIVTDLVDVRGFLKMKAGLKSVSI
ncbi:MAG: oligosaccharide flippase family protein [Christensenellales bacterium]